MAIKSVLALAVAGLLLGGALWFYEDKVPGSPDTAGKISAEMDGEIRSLVVEFGTKLKNVSLLMPPEDVARQLEEQYGPYLTPELLEKWQNDPASALGRSVSSPWPDRIDVVSVSPRGNNSFEVEGNVIEVTSADAPGEPAAVYPVTLIVEQQEGEWRIAGLTKGAYSELPRRMTVEGVWECVPLKTGQTSDEDCVEGVARYQSDAHFVVDRGPMEVMVSLEIGDHVRVEGVMVPANQLNSDYWQKYPIDGIISATTIEQMEPKF